VGILLFGFLWTKLPESIRHRVPEGWEAALLIPVVVAVGWFSIAISGHLENWLFGGNMRLWLSNDLGIPFDQRNALVVGLAMGFAVIPNIYSIAEDAVFSVPKSLTFGSLALGATPWQTLTRVVILTASPGIFSAKYLRLVKARGHAWISSRISRSACGSMGASMRSARSWIRRAGVRSPVNALANDDCSSKLM
jgi:phosphate transport system permease protein